MIRPLRCEFGRMDSLGKYKEKLTSSDCQLNREGMPKEFCLLKSCPGGRGRKKTDAGSQLVNVQQVGTWRSTWAAVALGR